MYVKPKKKNYKITQTIVFYLYKAKKKEKNLALHFEGAYGDACTTYLLTLTAMTKQDLVAAIAANAGLTKKAAADALEALINAITDELKRGGKVTLTGFGTFQVSKRAARTGVNPRNPTEKIQIPAMNLPVFKAGKSLKDSVR